MLSLFAGAPSAKQGRGEGAAADAASPARARAASEAASKVARQAPRRQGGMSLELRKRHVSRC